ncbi:MAG: SDR family NAD(P)-dependent oxidoreductase [Candidatus Heimdallarchaeaceae archaeon]
MKTVLITGASRGIGKALKFEFDKRGYSTIGHYRSEHGDLRDYETIVKLREISEANNVNVLVNCAGVYSGKCLAETTIDEIKEIIEVNLVAPMLLTKCLWKLLEKNKGTVININSVAGRVPEEDEIAYRVSKFGLAGFSSVLFHEGILKGIRIIDIPFGGIHTDMTKGRLGIDKNPLLQPLVVANVIIKILEERASKSIKHRAINGDIIDNIDYLESVFNA